LLLSGCASQALPERAATPSLELLSATDQAICWAGACIGDSRATIEKKLGLRLRPISTVTDIDMCGEFYSDARIAGRAVQFEWTARDGELAVLSVPLSASERDAPDAELLRAALRAVPTLVEDPESPLYFVLAANQEIAVNIKPDAPEWVFFVTHEGCVD
jgi:hypothetical protein